MDTVITEEKDGKFFNTFGEQIIKCKLCGSLTTMLGTKLCDRCWELKTRIEADFDLAHTIFLKTKRVPSTSVYGRERLKRLMDTDFDMTISIMSELVTEKTREERKKYETNAG